MSEVANLNLAIRLEREDSIPAFGGYLRCECPDRAHNHVILLNVQAIMTPELFDEEGNSAPQSREDRKRNLITTLMHEFGHALEQHFKLPDNEAAVEAACAAWEASTPGPSERISRFMMRY